MIQRRFEALGPGRDRERGLSLVELMVTLVLVPMVIGIGLMTMRSSRNVRDTVVATTRSLDQVRACLRRIGDEVMCSSRRAEDLNDNSVLDAGEDLNGNGRLERDWLVTANSIRLNRFLPNGTWSLPITYALQGNQLMRSELRANGTTVTASIAGSVLAFTVLAAADQVTISLSIGRAAGSHTSTIIVRQRN
jgi:prepilin-type N-terminal cleavage/methylation domain-containing protein